MPQEGPLSCRAAFLSSSLPGKGHQRARKTRHMALMPNMTMMPSQVHIRSIFCRVEFFLFAQSGPRYQLGPRQLQRLSNVSLFHFSGGVSCAKTKQSVDTKKNGQKNGPEKRPAMKLLSFVTQSIGRKIISAFTATLVLMMALAWISYSSIGELRSTSHWVSHTHEVLGQLERVSSELKDAETGQRGYLITGEDRYLEPYNSARTSAEEAVANLRDFGILPLIIPPSRSASTISPPSSTRSLRSFRKRSTCGAQKGSKPPVRWCDRTEARRPWTTFAPSSTRW